MLMFLAIATCASSLSVRSWAISSVFFLLSSGQRAARSVFRVSTSGSPAARDSMSAANSFIFFSISRVSISRTCDASGIRASSK